MVIDDHGEPWFVLADLCAVLESQNPAQIAARLDADMKRTNTLDLIEGITRGPGNPRVTVVSEPGMYEVVLRSDSPVAKPSRRWVTSDVLPIVYRVPIGPNQVETRLWLAVITRRLVVGLPAHPHGCATGLES
jgi:prophage antirepressor-like protein